jgi:hypothetical protein
MVSDLCFEEELIFDLKLKCMFFLNSRFLKGGNADLRNANQFIVNANFDLRIVWSKCSS